jgi:hypothetical protein
MERDVNGEEWADNWMMGSLWIDSWMERCVYVWMDGWIDG